MVNDSSDQFLPRTALPLQQHGRVALHDTTDGLVNLLHRHAVTDEMFVAAMHGSE